MITKQELKNLKYLASEGMVDHEKYKLLFTNDATDTVLRLIEALEVATKSLIKIRVNCSCTELCMCSEDDVFIAQEALNKIYGSIE